MESVTASALVEPDDVVWLRSGEALPAAVRREATALARRIGLASRRASEVALAVTEIATNLVRHADDGSIALRTTRFAGRASIECLSLDSGPGIPDLTDAFRDGHSSGSTLGIGLGAIARLADTVDVHSVPGKGTVLLARFSSRATASAEGAAPPEPRPPLAGLTRAISGETVCGDTWAGRPHSAEDGRPGSVTVMMCDGLGHGPLAARAGEAARAVFRQSAARRPADLLAQMHTGLRGTRGAAMAVAVVDLDAELVELCGVGNVSAFVVDAQQRSTLLSVPGIVGAQLPTLRTFTAPLPRGSALVMHSDGLHQRWSLSDLPGLLTRDPTVIAAQILNHAGVRRDDAGIVVVPGRPR
ncbi:ATP-binding protein [Streptomyces sp. NPDC049813]|uniref:ATP-binding protein n=1 Tax=Streptomyces sp. NPDC049813 TaxID=3365597 RepID=UPI0037B6DA31